MDMFVGIVKEELTENLHNNAIHNGGVSFGAFQKLSY